MRDPKRQVFPFAVVGCGWLAMVLGCSSLRPSSNAAANNSPAASPTNTATVSSTPSATPPGTGSKTGSSTGVTLANYDRLQNGMTYDQAVQILGRKGELQDFGQKIKGAAFKIDMYKWKGDGGAPDAEVTVYFKDGKLDNKLEYGLK